MSTIWTDYRKRFLMHHGIKGQKWGVRRFEDINGHLTKEGKLRYTKSLPLKLDLQMFAYKPKKPFKYRNKKEAAIVESEIKPKNFSRDDLKKYIVEKEINIDDQGAYVYTLKNQDGNGTFKPIARKRIRQSSTKLYRRNNDE